MNAEQEQVTFGRTRQGSTDVLRRLMDQSDKPGATDKGE